MVSTLNQHVAAALPHERAVSAAAGWRICRVILVLFVVAATLSAARKDVTRGYDFDEAARASYIAHIQHSGSLWPVLEDMGMLDTSSFQSTTEPNYLNHPSPCCALPAAAPCIVFMGHYGNQAPNTVGQITNLQTNGHAAGWCRAADVAGSYAVFFFVLTCISEWLPAWAPRNAFNYLALVIEADALAFMTTFLVHRFFSFQRHVDFGWLMDAYPRYYLPLAALVPLAGISLLTAIETPRGRGLPAS